MNKNWQYRYPDWLYNALPYFYLASGGLTLLTLNNLMGVFSGLTLVSAGAVVWRLRYRYRRAFTQSQGRMGVPFVASEGGSVSRLIEISWREAFDCGHPVIDAQHRRLFGVGNELINAAMQGKPKFDIECLLQELIDDIIEHFCTEECLLAQTANPLSKAHQQHHVGLLDKARSLQSLYQDDELPASELVAFIAYDVITEHILKEDIRWAVQGQKTPARASSLVGAGA